MLLQVGLGFWRDDEEEQEQPQTGNGLGFWRTEPAQTQPEQPGFGQRAAQVGMEGLRRVTGVLEPIQLPQDMLFGIAQAVRDEDLTIGDAFRRMDWRAYAPNIGFGIGGGTPERHISGKELLQLYGVQNETAANIGGFVMDLTADPLIAGAWIRGVGKAGTAAMRAAGRTDEADEVMRGVRQVAGLFDQSMAPATYGKALGSVRNPITQQAIERDVNMVIDSLSNWQPGVTFGWADRVVANTVGDLVRQPINSIRSQLGEAGRALGMSRIRGQAQGARVELQIMQDVDRVDQMLGGKGVGRTWLQQIMRAVSGKANAPRVLRDVPESMRDVILRNAHELVGESSPVVAAGQTLRTTTDEAGNMVNRAVVHGSPTDFARHAMQLGQHTTPGMGLQFAEAQSAALRRVYAVADEAGFSRAEAERLFREVSSRLSLADATVGYHLSMYEPIKANFIARFEQHTGHQGLGEDAWVDVMRQRWTNRGQNVEEITALGGRRKISELTDGQFQTIGDLMQSDDWLNSLNLNTYMDALRKGHMRRSYGIFMDPDGFNHYRDLARQGQLIPNHVLDEDRVVTHMVADGFEEEAGYLLDYMENVAPKGATRGGVVTRDRLMRLLTDERGVDPERAQQAMFAMMRSMNSEKYGEFLTKVEDAVSRYNTLLKGLPGTPSVGRIAERQELAQEQLEVLMELSNPLVSLAESAQLARRYIPQQEFLTQAYQLGRENGWISKVAGEIPNSERWGADSRILGPLANHYIHPLLAKEIRRGLITSNSRPHVLQTMKRNLTGGFLANPKSTVANVAGGILTTAGLGIEPDLMVREMTRNMPEMMRAVMDPDYIFEDLDELSRYIDFGAASMLRDNILDTDEVMRRMRERLSETGPRGLQGHLEAMSDAYRNALGLSGLEAFQATEAWMKVSAFTAAKRMGFEVEEAAELARLSTFDYGQLPVTLEWLKDKGIALFPGFPYFMAGRVMSTTLERPGVIALADRMPEAIANAALDEEAKAAWYAATQNTWMEQEGMAPIPGWTMREGAGDSAVMRMFPAQQLLPTNFVNLSIPMAEGISTLGLIGPLIDGGRALWGGATGSDTSGESEFYAQYGRRVFSENASPMDMLRDGAGYFYNSFAPAFMRTAATFDADTGLSGGIAGSLYRSTFPVPEQLAERGMTWDEAISRRESRTTAEEVVGAFFRTIQPASLDGPLATAPRNLSLAHAGLEQAVAAKTEQAREAQTPEARERLIAEIEQLHEEFLDEWGPVMQYLRQTNNP